MIKCPICELNYMQETEEMCDVCKQERGLLGNSRGQSSRDNSQIPQTQRYNGIAVFYVFQNESMFDYESAHKFIWAPYDSKGTTPHHWKRLENVKERDIILHGVGGYIRAISIATSTCHDAKNPLFINVPSGMQVNSEYYHLRHLLLTSNYTNVIKKYCTNKLYQPFNKNGTGNQGYLFDIDKNLAAFFINEICKYNPNISQLASIQTFLNNN